MHYLEECLIESHDENQEIFMIKIVWLSYLHLFNILLNQVEFLSWVVKSSFSTQFKLLSSTSQLNSTLFQKNFNSTQHFLSRVLDLNSSTRLDMISLFISFFFSIYLHYLKRSQSSSCQFQCMHVVQFNVMQQYKIILQNWTSMNASMIILYIFVNLSHFSQMQHDLLQILVSAFKLLSTKS